MLVILALLGIPLWFLVGIANVLLLRKRAVSAVPGTFPCQVRTDKVDADLTAKTWGGGMGRWERDVFVMSRMMTLTGFTAQAADELLANDIWFPEHGEVKRVGDKPVVLPIRLASGFTLEISVPPDLVLTAAGPFPVPAAAQQEIDGRAPLANAAA
jgi:hypothetical protein